jgi:hypothetical protein
MAEECMADDFDTKPMKELHAKRIAQREELAKLMAVKFSTPGKITTREEYLNAFQEVTRVMLATTTRKNNDYGGPDDPWKNFRDFGTLGIVVRMSDKFARIKTALVEKRGLEVSDESVEDTLIDLANYAIICLLYHRSERQ